MPDHSSLTRIRARYGIAVFRRFFEAIVEQCLQAKLVWGRELYVDATKVNANADLDSLVPRFAVEAREAYQAHLATLFAGEQEKPGNLDTFLIDWLRYLTGSRGPMRYLLLGIHAGHKREQQSFAHFT